MPDFGFYLTLAWRNCWRNKKRTLIAVSSILFAVVLSTFTTSVQEGQHAQMIQGTVKQISGYIQVHKTGYWENKSIDDAMVISESDLISIQNSPEVKTLLPRIETGVLVSKDTLTKVSPLIGIDPEAENDMSGLAKRVIAGKFLTDSSEGMLIAEGLAKRLGVTVGDTLILFGSGFHGSTVAAEIPIEGIVKYPLKQLNQAMILMSLNRAETLLDCEGYLTSLAIDLVKPASMDEVKTQIDTLLNSGFEVMTWKDLMPELVQAIAADDAGSYLMTSILYLVVGFGIFGTIMMMTQERIREFGILVAIGMKKAKLSIVVLTEIIFISLTGTLAGFLVSVPIVVWMYLFPIPVSGDMGEAMLNYGIEPFLFVSLAPFVFYSQALIILVFGILAAGYPFNVIRKLKPVEAMRR
ncbi:MAG: ABC transporter permease [Bacteroidetes bacterium]|nr:ABC transporter permease [Bacteroidota bacterium]